MKLDINNSLNSQQKQSDKLHMKPFFLKPVLLTIGLIFLCSTPSFSKVDSQSLTQKEVEGYFLTLEAHQRKSFHLNLMRVLAKRAKNTKYSEKVINVKIVSTHPQIFELILDNLISEAYAINTEDSTIYCNYAGWMTIHNETNECLPPWNRSVRNNSDIQNFGDTYSGNYSCSGARLIRCNPVVFGPGDDGKGMCATADDNDPTDSTQACLELYQQNQEYFQDHLVNLASNPEGLANYISIAAETLRFCDAYQDDFPYCQELKESLSSSASAAVTCTDQRELLSYMPDLVTPFNQEDLNQIVEGLGDRAVEYAEDLERRQIAVREQNRKVFEEAIEAYSNSQRTQDINERILDNTDRCIMDSCRGSKNRYRSVEYCARYVKYAMFPPASERGGRYGNFDEYPWGADAVESGSWLRREGFVNLLDNPEMQHLTPENAPEGAVIVYEKVTSRPTYTVDGVRRGGPGHIEIKVSDNQYVSDFINDEPTRLGGQRRPIGIYIHMPSEYRSRIQEVPER